MPFPLPNLLALLTALTLAFQVMTSPLPSPEQWHLPVPAGEWQISRGPCNSAAQFNHQCDYYEDHCAIDLTPIDLNMEHVPVLAPQAGQVFFLGQRYDAGITVMLRHADGRVSAMMHLGKAVVGLDERVAQGQVIGYAGHTGSASAPHVHFHLQPNAVERECLPLAQVDELNYEKMTARSHNLAWNQLTLIDPPPTLPDFLPYIPFNSDHPIITPRGVVLAPQTAFTLPVLINSSSVEEPLTVDGTVIASLTRTAQTAFYHLPLIAAEPPGQYTITLQHGPVQAVVPYHVRAAPDTSASQFMLEINPAFVSPENWSNFTQPPTLCWSEPASAGQAPLQFRVIVVEAHAGDHATIDNATESGAKSGADSGWQTFALTNNAYCWPIPHALPVGTYYWKVFVRDATGLMNRTNQRPFAFTLK